MSPLETYITFLFALIFLHDPYFHIRDKYYEETEFKIEIEAINCYDAKKIESYTLIIANQICEENGLEYLILKGSSSKNWDSVDIQRSKKIEYNMRNISNGILINFNISENKVNFISKCEKPNVIICQNIHKSLRLVYKDLNLKFKESKILLPPPKRSPFK